MTYPGSPRITTQAAGKHADGDPGAETIEKNCADAVSPTASRRRAPALRNHRAAISRAMRLVPRLSATMHLAARLQ